MINSTTPQGSFQKWDELWRNSFSNNRINHKFNPNKSDNILQFWQKMYAKDLFGFIEGKSFKSFCEMGSGQATTSLHLAHKGVKDITLVDLSRNAIESAVETFKYFNFTKPKVIFSDICNTPLPHNSMDCIYSIGVLEHFDNPKNVLAHSYNILAKDGLLYKVIVPQLSKSKSFWQHLMLYPLGLPGLMRAKKEQKDMVRTNYNMEYYKLICEDLGFKDVKCIPYNPYWNIGRNGWWKTNMILPLYQRHADSQRSHPYLRTSENLMFAYLLTATK